MKEIYIPTLSFRTGATRCLFFACLSFYMNFINVLLLFVGMALEFQIFFGSDILFLFYYLINKKHRKDVSNFDKQFTSEKLDLTPTGKLCMSTTTIYIFIYKLYLYFVESEMGTTSEKQIFIIFLLKFFSFFLQTSYL